MTSHKRLIPMALVLVAAAVYVPASRSQDASQPSLAEASRRAKAQQKNEPKGGKVFTDDDVDSLKGNISVVGPGAAPPVAEPVTTAALSAPAKAKAAPQEQKKNEAYWRKQFADARRALAFDSKELDVLQREFNLKQVQYYSDPNVALREQHSRKDIDDTQAQISLKKQDVEKDNQVISDLQDDLRKSGGEPGWANEEPQAAPEADSVPAAQPEQPAVTSHEAPQISEQPEQSETPSPAQEHPEQ